MTEPIKLQRVGQSINIPTHIQQPVGYSLGIRMISTGNLFSVEPDPDMLDSAELLAHPTFIR